VSNSNNGRLMVLTFNLEGRVRARRRNLGQKQEITLNLLSEREFFLSMDLTE
jgi:hypothetical protein